MKASLSVALALAGACLAVRAEAQTVVVGPSTGSMALLPGAQVTVPIMADLSGSGGASLGSITARLLWHPSVLAYRGSSAGALGAPVINADSAGGSLRFALANPAGVTGQPVLVNAIFAVVGAAGARDTLKVDLQELIRAGTFADLLPIGTATSSMVCVSTGVFGDLDASGTVTSADALVIVTSAVGLPIAPYTTVNGDVDGSGHVDTRDALIVLSYVVGLPVTGFRVSRLNGGACAVQMPASVQIQPGGATVAPGDRFPLTATVRDSGGAVVSGIGLVWTSADTTVVKADATGNLVGVGPGTAQVYANAAPGLKDSVTVTVAGTRHVWYVNPAVAALNGGVEHGSSTYPFSTIPQAVSRAGAFDSVFVAPAVYGQGVHLTRTIFLIGDSTAAGRTVIRNPTGPGVLVDSLSTSGGVGLHRLWIEDSFGGVVVEGGGTGVVDLRQVSVLRSRGIGVAVRRVGVAMLDHVVVRGAILRGVELDSVPVVRLHAISVDLVGPDGTSGHEVHAVRVAMADSVVVDSMLLATAGFRLDSARVASFGHFTVRGVTDAALWAIVGQRFVLDSADISGVSAVGSTSGDTMPAAVGVLLGRGAATARISHATIHGNNRPAFALSGADSVLWSRVSVLDSPTWSSPGDWTVVFALTRRVAIEYSAFAGANGTHVGFDGPDSTVQVTVDSSAFHGIALRAVNIGFLGVRRSVFDHFAGSAVQASGVRTVSLVGVDGSNTAPSMNFVGYGGPFLADVYAADSLRVDSSAFHDNRFGGLICRECRAVFAARSDFVRNLLDSSYPSGTNGGSLVLEFPGRALLYGLNVANAASNGIWLLVQGQGSHTVIDSSGLTSAPTLVRTDQGYYYSYGLGDTLVVSRSLLRSSGTGVAATALSSLTLSRSVFDSLNTGVLWSPLGTDTAKVYGNTFTNTQNTAFQSIYGTVAFDSNTVGPCGNSGYGYGVSLWYASGVITRNRITGCQYGVYAYAGSTPKRLRVIGNTIIGDTLSGVAVWAYTSFDSVTVVGNTIQRGLGDGIELSGWYSGIGYARVDSNLVQGMAGTGMVFNGTVAQVAMTYNTLADNQLGLAANVPVRGIFNTLSRNTTGASFNVLPLSTFFRRGNFVGNLHLALVNAYGPPGLRADSSYWGDPLGPRCVGPPPSCALSVAGDSVGPYVAFPPPASAFVDSAPPIPAPLAPAPPFRSARPVTAMPMRPAALPAAPPTARPVPVIVPRREGVRP